MDESVLRIRLKEFCAGKEGSWNEEPINQRGYTYATDGHVIIRVPKLKGYKTIRVPDFEALPWGEMDDPNEWKCVHAVNNFFEGTLRIGGKVVGAQFVKRIKRLPRPIWKLTGKPLDPIPFMFRGGEGLLATIKEGSNESL